MSLLIDWSKGSVMPLMRLKGFNASTAQDPWDILSMPRYPSVHPKYMLVL